MKFTAAASLILAFAADSMALSINTDNTIKSSQYKFEQEGSAD